MSNNHTHHHPAPDGYYSVAELQARWGSGRTHTYKLVHSPGFPAALRVGRLLRYPRHAVWVYEAEHDLVSNPYQPRPRAQPPEAGK
jgi:hypothetical protein